MSRSLLVAAIFSLCWLQAGCAQRSPSYADAYLDALERYQGTTEVTPAMTDRFVAFFSHGQHAPDRPIDPAELYGEPLYFSDTLLTTEDRAAALAHLERMREGAESLSVRVLNRLVDGQDVYLVWQMHATFEPLTGSVTSNTLGVTHLRFAADGRIILHQDFWDSAEGFYRHVPVLGGLINAVGTRFEDETP